MLSTLSKYSTEIRIYDINDHLWMIHFYRLPSEVTHRILVQCEIDGKKYTWTQFFNNFFVDFCYMTHYAAIVIENTVKKVRGASKTKN